MLPRYLIYLTESRIFDISYRKQNIFAYFTSKLACIRMCTDIFIPCKINKIRRKNNFKVLPVTTESNDESNKVMLSRIYNYFYYPTKFDCSSRHRFLRSRGVIIFCLLTGNRQTEILGENKRKYFLNIRQLYFIVYQFY